MQRFKAFRTESKFPTTGSKSPGVAISRDNGNTSAELPKVSPSRSSTVKAAGAQQLIEKQHPPLPHTTRTRNYSTNAMRTKRIGTQTGRQVGLSIRAKVEVQASSMAPKSGAPLRSTDGIRTDFDQIVAAINYTQSRVNKTKVEQMTAPGQQRDPRWASVAKSLDPQHFQPGGPEAEDIKGSQAARIIRATAGGGVQEKRANDLLTAVEYALTSQCELSVLLTREGATSEQIYAADQLSNVESTLQQSATVGFTERDEERAMLSTTLNSLPGQVVVQPFVRFLDLSTRLNALQKRIEQGRAGHLADQDDYDDAKENRLLIACANEIVKVYKLSLEKWALVSQVFRDPTLLQKAPGEAREVLQTYGWRLTRLKACAEAEGSPFQALLAQAQHVVASTKVQSPADSAIEATTGASEVAPVTVNSESTAAAKSLVESSGLSVQPLNRIKRILPPPPVAPKAAWMQPSKLTDSAAAA